MKKYRKHFTYVTHSLAPHNSSSNGRKREQESPAVFTTEDPSSPYHRHGQLQPWPLRHPTVFADVDITESCLESTLLHSPPPPARARASTTFP